VLIIAAKTDMGEKHGIEGNPKWDIIQEVLQEIQAEIQTFATDGAQEKVNTHPLCWVFFKLLM
jgi:hypothetical protein